MSCEYTLPGGHLLNIKGTRVDTLVRRAGKVFLLASEDRSTGTVGAR